MPNYHLYIGDRRYSSWSLRPWLLLRTLSIAFDTTRHPFADKATRRQRYLQFSPSGKVPCLVHEGQTLWDSLAIIEYLAEQHDRIYPKDRAARAWSRCAMAEMHAGFQALREHCPMDCQHQAALHPIPAAVQQDLDRIQALWQQGLSEFGGPYLAANTFTAVDAYYAPVALRILQYQLPVNDSCQAWIQRIYQLDSLQEWLRAAADEVQE